MRDCDLKDEFLKFISYGKHRAHRTIENYKVDLEQFVTFLSHKTETEKLAIVSTAKQANQSQEQSLSFLMNVDTKKIVVFISYLQKRNYSQSSIRRKLATLICFYKFLNSQHWLDYNPMTDIELPKVEKNIPKILTEEQIWQLIHLPSLDNWIGARDRAMLELLCSTGIRVSELVSLDATDVDFGNMQIRITSNNNKKRNINLSSTAVETLRYYLKLKPNMILPDNENSQKPLFINRFGSRLDTRSTDRRIEKYIRLAGLDKSITPYDFRHSFAQKLLQHGTGVKELCRLFGFESIPATQLYSESFR